MNSLYVIKIGGNVIDDPASLNSFLKDFAKLEGNKILIHGGGKIATRMSEDLGIKPQLVEGRRITDADSLKVVTMVYAGLINKGIVATLQAEGCNAIGLGGADGNMIRTKKRPPKDMVDKNGQISSTIDYGFVGDPDDESVNADALHRLLTAGFVPVFSAITHDGKGQLLNTNADTIASVIAVSMSSLYATSLVYCFEKSGVMEDVNDESSVIKQIDPGYYKELKHKGVINDGMIPKLDNAFEAISRGVHEVCIGKADTLLLLKEETFGTRLKSV
jgi:acetylglutamate kinase